MDEVASPLFLMGNKKLLQAHVDGAILGQSATQLFSYKVPLWRTPIMLTTNNFGLDGLSEADRNWIETNAVAVHIGDRVWRSGASPRLTPVASPCPSDSSVGQARRVWASPAARGQAGFVRSPDRKRPR